MRTRISKSITGISIILSATATANSAPADFTKHDFGDCRRASERELDDMRGGFQISAGGMQFLLALGIERVTYVNGILVAMHSLNLLPNSSASQNISQLGQLLNNQISTSVMQQTSLPSSVPADASPVPTGNSVVPADNAVASPGNAVASPGNAIVSPTPNNPVAQPSVPEASPVTTSPPIVSIPAPGSNNMQPVQLIQVGQGNTFVPANIANLSTGIMTVVQNRIDNQIIQNMTIINATLANRDMIRSMAISAALSRMPAYLSR